MENLNKIIANNLATLRKKSNLTQMQLAEKINYSDKAISKWEKGDSLPSINVLMQLAEFYGVKIDDIVYEKKLVIPKKKNKREQTLLGLLLFFSVWLVATVCFVVLKFIPTISREWLSFIVAIPVSFLVLTIYLSILKSPIFTSFFASIFVWTTILTINLFLISYQVWIIYLIGCPLQLIIILGTILNCIRHRVKE